MPELKTIKVAALDPEYHKGEAFTINESDFDPEQHKLFSDNEQKLTDDQKATDKQAGGEAGKSKPKQ